MSIHDKLMLEILHRYDSNYNEIKLKKDKILGGNHIHLLNDNKDLIIQMINDNNFNVIKEINNCNMYIIAIYYIIINDLSNMKKCFLYILESKFNKKCYKNYSDTYRLKYYILNRKLYDEFVVDMLASYHYNVRDYNEMIMYVDIGIKQKSVDIFNLMGYYYFNVIKNYVEMEKYYLMSNTSQAMYNLGFYHHSITKNYVEMEKYYGIAIALNNSDAMYKYRILSS